VASYKKVSNQVIAVLDGLDAGKDHLGREGGKDLRGLLEVGNQVIAVLGRLNAGKHHLGALDVVLGRQEVLEEGVLPPHDAGVLVSGGVGVVLRLA